jgi:hypothetical protein
MSQERTLHGSSALRRQPDDHVAVALAGATQRLETGEDSRIVS